MSDFAVYSEDAAKVVKLMRAYLLSVKAEYVVLCHRDGSVVAEAGSFNGDAMPLAVLSTASFDSASHIGAMLGGEKFQAVSYIGESRAVYISPVDASLILIQIFSGRLPNRIEDYNRMLIDKLLDAVPSFTQNTSSLVR